jgi:hypothetical protein
LEKQVDAAIFLNLTSQLTKELGMYVFRGPKKSAGASQVELVDVVNLSQASRAWTEEKVVQFTVSKESARQRQAVAHIRLTEEDVIALYEGLVKGWRKQIKASKARRNRSDGV